MKDMQVTVISFIISITLVGVMIIVADILSQKHLSLDRELIISINLLYTPIGVGMILTLLLNNVFNSPEIIFTAIVIIELVSQIYWIVMIYLILRKFSGIEEKKAIITTLIINYCFLLINILIL